MSHSDTPSPWAISPRCDDFCTTALPPAPSTTRFTHSDGVTLRALRTFTRRRRRFANVDRAAIVTSDSAASTSTVEMSHRLVSPPNCHFTVAPMSASFDFDNARSGSCETSVSCATVAVDASKRTESISCATDAVRSSLSSDRLPEPRNGIARPESGWRRCGFGSGYTFSSTVV